MEEEIDDLVGDVRYTDSQKSVTTSIAYSPDFTDSSSDKNQSSSKNTYLLDWDDSDDSDKTFQIHHDTSIVNLKNQIESLTEKQNFIRDPIKTINKSASISLQACAIVSQEIYTQTSKTIFDLVGKETDLRVSRDSRTLQTQTSFLSVTANKTVEYKIEVEGIHENSTIHNIIDNIQDEQRDSYNLLNYIHNTNNSQGDSSTKYPDSETQNEITEDADSVSTCSDRIIQFIDAESDQDMVDKDENSYVNSCDIERYKFESDIEDDSLILNENENDTTKKIDSMSDTSIPRSVDNEVQELYNKMSESMRVFSPEKSLDSNLRRFGTLTPLTEETMPKNDSIIDVTPCIKTISKPIEEKTKKNPYLNNSGIKLSQSVDTPTNKDRFKLPPIKRNLSCPNSPNLNFLFSNNSSSYNERQSTIEKRETLLDRWEHCTKDLASGESPLISGRSDPVQITSVRDLFRLPPIHMEGILHNTNNKMQYFSTSVINSPLKDLFNQESININDKIRELKETDRKPRQATSRVGSPTSNSSPDEIRLCDAAERGSEALCAELLRRLRSSSWTDAADTLEELPRVLSKFWGVLSENRIADLLRQVAVHVDSPRTQVARLACNTIAEILKNTNYTKKPDFYEAITTLLTKTGSLSRPVRRAANVALDEIVSSAELSHAVTALCVHGVGHKSALVRCAAARLLVVCCALGEGGRLLLRARPPSAATARRHVLRSLAALLDDKNIETRKYAERLYIMLRSLRNFEAYFLTDVDVELAARQMKKLDQILIKTPKTR